MDLESPVKPEAGDTAGLEAPLVNGQGEGGEGGEGPGEDKAQKVEGVGVRAVQDSVSPAKTGPPLSPQLNGALDNSVAAADSVVTNISQDITNHNVDTRVTNKYLIHNYDAATVFSYDSPGTAPLSTAAQRSASPGRTGDQRSPQVTCPLLTHRGCAGVHVRIFLHPL